MLAVTGAGRQAAHCCDSGWVGCRVFSLQDAADDASGRKWVDRGRAGFRLRRKSTAAPVQLLDVNGRCAHVAHEGVAKTIDMRLPLFTIFIGVDIVGLE